ncbi:MAG: hypothetical protein AB1778_09050 [Candidatus Bipolaricaulota bacterium]
MRVDHRTRRSWKPRPRRRPGRRPRLAIPREATLLLLSGLIVCAVLFLYIRQTTVLRTLTAECASAREDLVERQEVNHALALAIEEALSLERISKYATERLNMTTPTNPRYVYVPTRIHP